MKARLLPVCAVLASCLALPAFADSITFSDGTFNLANYSGSTYSVGLTRSASQCASCGNPGSALQVAVTGNGASTENYSQAFVNSTFTYNPLTQGAITTINASVDKNVTATFAESFTNTFRPTIFQDGIYIWPLCQARTELFQAAAAQRAFSISRLPD